MAEYVRTTGTVNDDELMAQGTDGLIELLMGLAGMDVLLGAGGSDLLLGGNDDDVLDGAGGDDSLAGGGGDDVLVGGNGRDDLRGGAGNDLLLGDSGDDRLHGGDGDDLLSGGSGSDVLIGGAGNDRFSFEDADDSASVDVIVDFGVGDDTIELQGAAGYRMLPEVIEFAELPSKEQILAHLTTAHDLANAAIVFTDGTDSVLYINGQGSGAVSYDGLYVKLLGWGENLTAEQIAGVGAGSNNPTITEDNTPDTPLDAGNDSYVIDFNDSGELDYYIDGFGADDSLDVADASIALMTFRNLSGDDGDLEIVVPNIVTGQVTTIHLLGIAAEQDAQIHNLSSFGEVFGVDSIV